MIDRDAVRRLLEPIVGWMERGEDPWGANIRYWKGRDALLNEGVSFEGAGWELLSNIDTAMDSFNPEPDRNPDQLDEQQLRTEIEAALRGLRSLGLID